MKGASSHAAANVIVIVIVIGVLALGVQEPASGSPAPAAERALRVCADPQALPLSNEKGEGFENRAAEMIAKELGARTEYFWWTTSRRGFFRNTLSAKKCDLVMGVPADLGKTFDSILTTKPWYRSTFVFVTKKPELANLRSLDDARLRSLRIGVPLVGDDGANPAPIHALSRRGIIANVRGFAVQKNDHGGHAGAALSAVANGELDVAILWGPIAGPLARARKLAATPVAEERDAELSLAFSIAMATRRDDAALAKEIDDVMSRRSEALKKIVTEAGVPLLEEETKP